MSRQITNRIFELFVVASPGDRGARAMNVLLVLSIFIGATAQACEYWLAEYTAGYELHLFWLYRVQLGLFALEYFARIWAGHTDGARTAGRRFIARPLHPLMLVDLLVIITPLIGVPMPADLRVLRLLRLPDLLHRIQRTMATPHLPEGQVPFVQVVAQARQQAGALRQTLAATAKKDVEELRGRIDATLTALRPLQAQMLRAEPQDREELAVQARQVIEASLTDLEKYLLEDRRLANLRRAGEEGFGASAELFTQGESEAFYAADLRWMGRRAYRPVPAAALGQHHFRDVGRAAVPLLTSFEAGYSAVVSEGITVARSAFDNVSDVLERSDLGGVRLRTGWNRATNRCRELSDLLRGEWDRLLWEMERLHAERFELIDTDVRRHGQLEFHLARGARWTMGYLRRGLEQSEKSARRLGPLLVEATRTTWAEAGETVREVLMWLGAAPPAPERAQQAADEARLTWVLERGLPDDYVDHFRFEPLDDDTLVVGFDEELTQVETAVRRWQEELTSSFVLYGQRGGGKTTLLNVACERLFGDSENLARHTFTSKITTTQDLALELATVLELEETRSIQELGASLLAGPRRVVVLEGCHNLFLRHIGGLEAIRNLLWLIARTNHHVLWGVCLDEYARDYLARWLPFGRLFQEQIKIRPWEGEELRRLILRRHHLSGYRIRYETGPTVARALKRRVRRYRHIEEPAVQRALEEIYFDELAESCEENILATLYYWLRSVQAKSSDVLSVAPLVPLELARVREVSMNVAFLLAAVLQHDNLTAGELASVTDGDPIDTRLELEILWNQNVLECDMETGKFRLNPVALSPVLATLRTRNLL